MSDINLWLMSVLCPKSTGIAGTVIWFSAGEPTDVEGLGPRLWVVLGDKINPQGLRGAASVLLTDPPEVLGDLTASMTDQVVRFAKLNREMFLAHWEGETDTGETLAFLRRVDEPVPSVDDRPSMIPTGVLAVAKKVSAFLDKHGVPHALAGGIAVSAHGHPRMTVEVEVLVASRARKTIRLLGKTTPRSGFLRAVSVSIDGIRVTFFFLGKGISPIDLDTGPLLADLPVVNLVALVVMKLGSRMTKDLADVVHLLKLGVVPVTKVEQRLAEAGREDFRLVVKMAQAEMAGDMKAVRRLVLARRL